MRYNRRAVGIAWEELNVWPRHVGRHDLETSMAYDEPCRFWDTPSRNRRWLRPYGRPEEWEPGLTAIFGRPLMANGP